MGPSLTGPRPRTPCIAKGNRMSHDPGGTQLAHVIAHEYVAAYAPEEAQHFEEIVAQTACDADSDDNLAIGLGELITPISPIVLTAVTTGVGFILSQIADAALDIGKDLVKEWVKDRVQARRPEKSIHPLSLGVLDGMKSEVFNRAVAEGLSEAQAAELAAFVAKRLS